MKYLRTVSKRSWEFPATGSGDRSPGGFRTSTGLFSLLLVALVAPLWAQDSEPIDANKDDRVEKRIAPSEGAREPDPHRLPAPLEGATTNLSDLEASGHLSVIAVEARPVTSLGAKALVWTIQVNKPITYRHVTMMLRHYRDVRFYDSQDLDEMHSALLIYPERLDLGADNRKVFSADSEFPIWISFQDDIRRRMEQRDVGRIAFRPLPR